MIKNSYLFAKNLSYHYGKKRVIDRLSFQIPIGSRVAVVGLNGAGKSTLLQLLIGELTSLNTEVFFASSDSLEAPINSNQAEGGKLCIAKSQIGYQAAAMRPLKGLTALEYLQMKWSLTEFSQGLSAEENLAVINQVIDDWDLEAIQHQLITDLSQGNFQKLCVAQAFLGSPALIVLDEPTQALDPIAQTLFGEKLQDLSKQQTCLFSSHHINEVVTSADQVLMMHEGNLVARLQLHNETEIWIAIQTSEPIIALKISHEAHNLALVYLGKKYSLYSTHLTEKHDIESLTSAISEQLPTAKILGKNKNAMMPLFTLLANQEL